MTGFEKGLSPFDQRAAPVFEMMRAMPELQKGFLTGRPNWDRVSVVGVLCSLLLDCGSFQVNIPEGHTSPDQIALVLCARSNITPFRVIVPCTKSRAGVLAAWMSSVMETKRWRVLPEPDLDVEMQVAVYQTVSVCYATEPRIAEAVRQQPFHALFVREDYQMLASNVDAAWARAPRVAIVSYARPCATFSWNGTDHQNKQWARVQAFVLKGGPPLQTPMLWQPMMPATRVASM